ncbi:kinase-like domain-containing protein [Paraphysoderma sedebokerense]|nr:kinase-like domain-containing protein [Paraphysoderma sedebokerense]
MIKSPDLCVNDSQQEGFCGPDRYKATTSVDEIRSSEYGVVYRSIDFKTNEKVTIKKRQYKDLVENELQMLKAASGHPNIINLLDSFIDDRGCCNIVMPLCETTLASAITERMTTEMDSIRNILLRLENEEYVVKLSDFGLAKHHRIDRAAPTTVATTPYRAPELCYNAYSSHVVYGTEMGMWSFGCVLAEMKLGNYLFSTPASPVVDVLRILGFPPQHLKAIGIDYKGDQLQPKGIHSCFDGHKVTRYYLELLTEILKWDPRERWSADRTLYHAFFSTPKQDMEVEIIKKRVVLCDTLYFTVVPNH